MTGLVSIVIPTYDRPKLLALTLESIVAQQYTNFEIIVVDDGSPNDLTKKLCNNFPKVRYKKIANSGGPSTPRNQALRMAKGEYVAFVDDDDLWDPEKLIKQIAVFESNPEVDLVHCCCRLISEDGLPLNQIIGRPGDPSEKSGKVYMRMIGNWTLMTSSVLIRKSLIEKTGFFNEQMPAAGEDMEYWTRCALRGTFYYLDEPLVLYRRHFGTSAKNLKKYIEVPGYLLKVITQAKGQGLLKHAEYAQLTTQLIRMQIKKIHLGWFNSLRKLFILNPFWFLNFDNIKLFAVVLFKRS